MTLFNENEHKGLLYLYIGLISFNILTNFIGNIYLEIRSEEESKIIATSLEEYEKMETDEATQTVIANLEQVKSNAKIFLKNTLLDKMVMIVVSCVVFIPEIIRKCIEKFGEDDITYSEELIKIVIISKIVAIANILIDFFSALDEISTYNHLMDYYRSIYNSLDGLNQNIWSNFNF